jgi:hypothetical protein
MGRATRGGWRRVTGARPDESGEIDRGGLARCTQVSIMNDMKTASKTFTVTTTNNGAVVMSEQIAGLWPAKARAVDIRRTLCAFGAEPDMVTVKSEAGRSMVSYPRD